MPLSGEALPVPKEAQTKPGRPRKYRRKVAGPKQWAALRTEKLTGESCRCCAGASSLPLSLHHLVSRSLGGDDVADNLAPLCGDGTRGCHGRVENRELAFLTVLAESLTDAEYAYIIGKLGEAGPERLFGVNR